MKNWIFAPLFVAYFLLSGCNTLNKIATAALEDYIESQAISTLDAIGGLKEALDFGTDDAVGLLMQDNGFYNNERLRIPFPKELQSVEQTLRNFGLEDITEMFVKELNKGASKAVALAKPYFKSAIEQMTFNDAMGILLGKERAATDYFERVTRQKLYNEFMPEVSSVLDTYGISDGYREIMNTYNMIPFVKPVNADLPDYVTNKTLDALYYKISLEEMRIRGDVSARRTQLLQRVFGYADVQKQNNTQM